VTTNFTPLTHTLGARGAVFGVVLATVVGAAIVARSPARVVATPFTAPKTVLPARISTADLSTVISEVGGTVSTVYVSAGAKVSSGQVIALIDSSEIRSTLARAEAHWNLLQQRSYGAPVLDGRSRGILNEQLSAARRNLEVARQRLTQFSLEDYEKAYRDAVQRRDDVDRLMHERSLATKLELANAEARAEGTLRDLNSQRQLLSRLQQERDAAQSQLKVIEMQLEPAKPGARDASAGSGVVAELERKEAELALAAARRQVEGLTIRARTSGTVLAVKVKPGDFAWAGSPIASVSDMSELALEAPMSAEVAMQIPVGKTVYVRLPNQPAKAHKATVTAVTLVPDQPQQAYLLRVVMPNPNPQVILAGLEGAVEIQHTGQEK
jgi:multidrug resistance efflux pump